VIAARAPGVASLRDVDLAMLERHAGELDETIVRRCRHVIEENGRVLAAVDAFERGDLAAVGRLFAASHASLQDLYEVSSPELDAMVEIARSVPGTVAARMTGAGFGGCTVNIVATNAVASFRDAILDQYPRRTGLPGAVYVVHAADGAGFATDRRARTAA
jgi:galactokinase